MIAVEFASVLERTTQPTKTETYGSTASFPLLAWGLQRSTVGLADRAPTIEASPQRGSQAVEDDEHLAAFVTEYG